MLAFITDYWFATLPTVLTAFFLLRKLRKVREEAAAVKPVPATIAIKKQGS